VTLSNQQLVRQFHEAMGMPAADRPQVPPSRRLELRANLHAEEFTELDDEMSVPETPGLPPSLPKIAKESADLLYVLYGTAVEAGFDLDEVFRQVHTSNMTKVWPDGFPRFRDDGKVLKPPTYQPPQIELRPAPGLPQ
jgi:predicted HAD superfamily Cof-like phosphohydrolase